jgi:hypothetical protein
MALLPFRKFEKVPCDTVGVSKLPFVMREMAWAGENEDSMAIPATATE